VDVDIAAGRLIVPFDVVLPADAGYYIVTPEETADLTEIVLFRKWLVHSVALRAEVATSQGRRGSQDRDRDA